MVKKGVFPLFENDVGWYLWDENDFIWGTILFDEVARQLQKIL